MFCPECGMQLEDGSYKCVACKWTWESREQETICSDYLVESNENGEISNNEDNMDDTMSTKNNVEKKGINKKKLITITIVLLLISTVITLSVLYTSTDRYKVKQASTYIVANDFDKGAELLERVYTPQAIETKAFINVEKAAYDFKEIMYEYDYQYEETIEESELWESYDNFKSVFEKYNTMYGGKNLADELKEDFECYKTAFSYISDYTSIHSEMAKALTEVQLIKLNSIDVNNGSSFTLEELQKRIDITWLNIGVLNKYDGGHIYITDPEVISNCKIMTHTMEGEPIISYNPIDSVISECEDLITTSQALVFKLSKEYGYSEYIIYTTQESEYISYNEVDAEIKDNVNRILNNMRVEMLYELI